MTQPTMRIHELDELMSLPDDAWIIVDNPADDTMAEKVRVSTVKAAIRNLPNPPSAGASIAKYNLQVATDGTETWVADTGGGGGGSDDGVADSVDLSLVGQELTVTIGRSVGADLTA